MKLLSHGLSRLISLRSLDLSLKGNCLILNDNIINILSQGLKFLTSLNSLVLDLRSNMLGLLNIEENVFI